VARLGGDEFAILLPTVGSVEDAEAFTRRVQSEVFDEPFDIDGLVLHVDTSIGLAVLPEHADDVTDLMARADVAMYTAKAAGIGIATYSAAVDGNSESRLTLLGDLRRALDTDDQLVMHYQPKVDLRTGRVVGLEALLRWWHPVQGLVAPNEFIPVAEQTGLMHQLTARVLGLVASQIAVWQREGEVLPVAVNLSARNLLEPNLDEVVAALLDMHQISPHLLEFEITESAIVEDPRRAGEMLRRLSAMGIAVAVDDFGIGNTSMGQLRSMPLNTIKIDASFVTNLGHDEAGGVLVRAIVDLAHEFGLVAVAEGVEDEAAIVRLRDLDCDVAQGFHWSRPVPAAELPAVLERIRTQPTVGGAPVRS
jgi:predicted signal transduction protein with EAL and GGDEF domain